MSPSSGMKPREPRRTVLIPARMRRDGARVDVCIRNISSRGLLVQAAAPPPRGTYVEIFLARHTIVGRVIWSKDRRFGLQSQERIDVGAIVDEATHAHSARYVDPASRLPGPRKPGPHSPTAAEVAQRLERSRRLSAALEFGCLIACSAAAAAFTVSVVFETLSRPIESVASHLR